MSELSIEQKKKVYWKIFYILTVLTLFEVFIGFAPLPALVIKLMIVVASLSKAFAVGWVYMHLNHETKGLRVLLLFPLFVASFYAFVLIPDSHFTQSRHSNVYIGQRERFFGHRNLKDRKVDDFGNTVIEEKVVAHGEEHAEEAHGEAKPEATKSEAPEAAKHSESNGGK